MGKYLIENRLEDVVRFIQVAGLRQHFASADQATHNDLEPPRSATRWIDIAEQHPEFFRVAGGHEDPAQHELSLLARFYHMVDGQRRPLPWSYVSKLIETAVSLHERQVRNRDRRNALVAFVGAVAAAIIAGVFGILAKK